MKRYLSHRQTAMGWASLHICIISPWGFTVLSHNKGNLGKLDICPHWMAAAQDCLRDHQDLSLLDGCSTRLFEGSSRSVPTGWLQHKTDWGITKICPYWMAAPQDRLRDHQDLSLLDGCTARLFEGSPRSVPTGWLQHNTVWGITKNWPNLMAAALDCLRDHQELAKLDGCSIRLFEGSPRTGQTGWLQHKTVWGITKNWPNWMAAA